MTEQFVNKIHAKNLLVFNNFVYFDFFREINFNVIQVNRTTQTFFFSRRKK